VKGKPAGYSEGEPGALAVASRRKKDKTKEVPRILGSVSITGLILVLYVRGLLGF
jgi:hypothetical protein